MADFKNANKVLSRAQLDFIQCRDNYVITENILGFSARDMEQIILCYAENAMYVRTFLDYHDTTQTMHEIQLIIKAKRASDMSQYGFASLLANVIDLQIAGEINKFVSDVTVVRQSSDDKREFVKYAKVLFIVKAEEAYSLNNVINLIKKHLIGNINLVRYLGGNGTDSVCHFTTNKNSAYLYNYRIHGIRLNFFSCSIKDYGSLQQIAIFFASNMKDLKPGQWEFFASFDALNQRFKINSFELSSNTRIEALSDEERVFFPKNYTINGLPCGLNLRITRLGRIKMATKSELLINNECQKSDFQQKMNSLCVHDPVIQKIHVQARKYGKYQISKPLLIDAMIRIFNYKKSEICPQDTIKYAIKNKIWSINAATIYFDACLNQNDGHSDNGDDNDTDMENEHEINTVNQMRALQFGGPQNEVDRHSA